MAELALSTRLRAAEEVSESGASELGSEMFADGFDVIWLRLRR